MAGLSVLICGGGIAGPAVGYFLSQAGSKVTIVERSPEPRPGGQSVDIRGHGLSVIRHMGLEDAIRKCHTHEKGIQFVDSRNGVHAEFPVDQGQGFTGEIEISRGDLAGILYANTKERVKYVFGESIAALRDTADGVEVEFTSGKTQTQTYDLVVAADGWASRTRALAFGKEFHEKSFHDLGQWAAWFSLPSQPQDRPFARWYNAPGGRMMLVRPDNDAETTRASLWILPTNDSLDKIVQQPREKQKALWAELFADAGWEAPRLLRSIVDNDDFYMQKIAQVKVDHLSSGRTVLVGDAGYCPTPISGMGTTAALVGAYILAGEVAKHGKADLNRALEAYEERMKPLIKRFQTIPPGAPQIANPRSQWGIWILYKFLGLVAWSGIWKLFESSSRPANKSEVPQYSFPCLKPDSASSTKG